MKLFETTKKDIYDLTKNFEILNYQSARKFFSKNIIDLAKMRPDRFLAKINGIKYYLGSKVRIKNLDKKR